MSDTVQAEATEVSPSYECGICWQVYDPVTGDDIWPVPPGTAFADLPELWTCPNCEAPKHKFMKLSP